MVRTTGHYERTAAAGEEVRAFVPDPLPPANPPLDLGGALASRLALADEAVRRLEIAGAHVPSLDWLLYGFVRKEAVITSQIEGTQATLIDLLRVESDEATPPPDADVHEVCNYLAALEYARAEMAAPRGLPISIPLLNETHRRLMRGVRGAHKLPGEIRRSQNWIGGSRPGNASFVPPPPNRVLALLGDLETYVHRGDAHPPLVRAGLAHAQFETIHPYLDGNGRIGRLLVALLLEHWGVVTRPLLYLSLHFKRHRAEYYRRLDSVRGEGDWEGWLDFFLDGVATTAAEATRTIHDLTALVEGDRRRVLAAAGRSTAALRLFDALPRHPVVTAKAAMRLLEASKPTAGRALDALVEARVLSEGSGRRRDRWYLYRRYVDRLGAED